jgi:hypothetical protein
MSITHLYLIIVLGSDVRECHDVQQAADADFTEREREKSFRRFSDVMPNAFSLLWLTTVVYFQARDLSVCLLSKENTWKDELQMSLMEDELL